MKSLSLVLGLFTVVFIVSGCSSEYKREFMRGCKSSGATSAICHCHYDNVMSKYSEGQLRSLEGLLAKNQFIGKKELPDEVVEFMKYAEKSVLTCAAKMR